MKRIMYAVLAIFVMLVLTSCGPDEFEYKVHVQTEEDGVSIQNAKVTVSGPGPTKTVLTDAEGNASVYIDADFVDKAGKLTISSEIYEPYTLSVTFSQQSLPQDVALKLATFEYYVHVIDSGTDQAISDVEVSITGSGGLSKTAMTDNNGDASIYIDANMIGKKGVLGVAKGDLFEAYSQEIILLEDVLPARIVLIPKGFTYEVLIKSSENGTPVKDATVLIQPDGSAGISGITDDYGIAKLEIDADVVGRDGVLSVRANGFGDFTNNVMITSDELPDTVQFSGFGPYRIAEFDNCTNTNILGGQMGGAYNSPDSLTEDYVQEDGRGCVAKLEFSIREWAAFWQQLQAADFTPYETLSFDIRADADSNIPDQIKIELKRPGDEIEVIVVSGITTEWQTITVNLSDFGPTGYGNRLSSLTGMSELVFVFTSDLSGRSGIVYLDNITLNPR